MDGNADEDWAHHGASPAESRAWLASGLVAFMVLVVARWTLELGAPLGPDPAMWGLAASELAVGNRPGVQPAYPTLIAVLASVTTAPPWRVGAWLAMCCAAAVPAVVGVVGRRLGLPRHLAVGAAVFTFLCPDLLAFAWQLQPDSLATLVTLWVLAAGLRGDRRGRVSWLVAALILVLAREHGLVVLPATLMALVAARRPVVAWCAGGVAVAGAVAWVLAGSTEWLPSRLAMPLEEWPLAAGRGPLPSYASEIGGEAGRSLRVAWLDGDALGVWLVLVERLLARSGENLLVIGLGLAGYVAHRRRRAGSLPAALVALSPVAMLVVIWSHRRHTSVLLPVALLGVAVGVQALVRRWPGWRWPIRGLAVLCGLFLVRDTPDTLRALTGAAAHGHDRIALARWMASEPGEWFLGGQHNEVNLHLLWPRHNPALPRPGEAMPTAWSGTSWRTMWVSPPGTMPPPFTQVHRVGSLAAFRLEAAPGAARPCAHVTPLPGPLFTAEHIEGRSSPPCTAPAWFGSRPPHPDQIWEGHPFVPPERPR